MELLRRRKTALAADRLAMDVRSNDLGTSRVLIAGVHVAKNSASRLSASHGGMTAHSVAAVLGRAIHAAKILLRCGFCKWAGRDCHSGRRSADEVMEPRDAFARSHSRSQGIHVHSSRGHAYRLLELTLVKIVE